MTERVGRQVAQAREKRVSARIAENRSYLEAELGYGVSFDVIIKDLSVAGKKAFLLAIDGFVNTIVMTEVINFLLRSRREDLAPVTAEKLLTRRIGYIETERETDLDKVITKVLAGFIALFVMAKTRPY